MANQPTKYSKFLVGAASAALVAAAVAPVASAADFNDTKGNTHEEAINALADAGVISGYPDGSFQPNKTLTRSDVVKLLGKWLVSEGASIPADAVSNPRFTDLTSSSNKELLEYAAVVKDNGVFIGSNGRLLAADNISRENMAVVLVRAFDNVKGIDLVSYVNGQDFKADVADLKTAKSEAQGAINVLDFFDITNPTVANFNPKGSTTRGHFATFLYKSINTDFSAVTGSVAAGAVKAINATTVEVTFNEAVENVSGFTIEGLTVSNAAVKQSDNKVVVLTTAVQEGGKKYTVSHAGKEIGSFEGISSVIPTKIDITTASVQGKVGAQATVSADVGVKQAGIPVTFNVKANTINTLNKDQVFEAVTNADGIATFSYTQYSAGTDSVVAYPTGAPTVRSLGYVFWGVDTILAIEEVVKGDTVNNGANKTYKVTYKNPTTGKVEANKTFNVSILENINVTADKLQNVTVNGVEVAQLSNSTVTRTAQITTDSKGEATFTVSGTNATATPVVFEAQNTRTSNGAVSYDYNYEASDLQATASKVKFAAVQAEYKIDVTRDGDEVAAVGEANGRVYKVLVKDKDGKVAKNETVNIAFNEDLDRVIATNTQAKFVNADTDKYYPTNGTGNTASQISVKTNAKGEASFVIASEKLDDYATPVAWIDINTSNAKQGKLDEGEPTFVAAISHFQAPYLDGAKIIAKKNGAGKATDQFEATDKAVFSAELVNQSNKVFTAGYSIEKITYTVFNEGAEDVIVDGVTISPNRSESFTKSGSLTVESVNQKSTAVRVVATGTAKKDNKDFIFTAKEAKATFTSKTAINKEHTGNVVAANETSLVFDGKDALSLKDAKFIGSNGSELIGVDAFLKELNDVAKSGGAAAKQGVVVTYLVDKEDVVTFKVVRYTSTGAEYNIGTSLSAINEIVEAKNPVPATAATAATATITITGANPTVKVNNTVYTHDVNAGAQHGNLYNSVADLEAKINASNGVVTATQAGGVLTLKGASNGDSFTYEVGNLGEFTATGTKATGGVNQVLEFTFTEVPQLQDAAGKFISITAGQSVAITDGAATKVGTVKSVQANKVVVEIAGFATNEVSAATITLVDIAGLTVVGKVSEAGQTLTGTVTYK